MLHWWQQTHEAQTKAQPDNMQHASRIRHVAYCLRDACPLVSSDCKIISLEFPQSYHSVYLNFLTHAQHRKKIQSNHNKAERKIKFNAVITNTRDPSIFQLHPQIAF